MILFETFIIIIWLYQDRKQGQKKKTFKPTLQFYNTYISY